MEKLSILIVEDNPGDIRLVGEMLRESVGTSFRLLCAERLESALQLLSGEKADVVLLDLNLPDSRGLEGLEKLVACEPDLPVIVLTSLNDETTGMQAVQKHAEDYLVKGQINNHILIRSIKYAIERKKMEKALATERANLQLIFDAVNVGLMLIDGEELVRRVNNVVLKWTGKGPAGISGLDPGEALGCVHIKNLQGAECGHTPHCAGCQLRGAFVTVLRTGKPVHNMQAEATFFIEGGKNRVWLEINADPLLLENKRHVILALNDITKLKTAEEVLTRDKETFERLVGERTRQLLDVQLELDRTKRLSDIGTLAATVAHELRNPLAAIGMAAANIKRKTNEAASLEGHLRNIEKKVQESDQIINNLLFYSRIKAPHLEKTQLYGIIEECVDSAWKQSKKTISIKEKFDSLKDLTMDADPIQMRELFQNVLNNACDAVKDGSGKIKISASEGNNSVTVCIEDNGSGIEKADLEKIFDPFFTTKAKGTGLGLSVCKQIVSIHGGSINIESAPGKGTIVTITLPRIYTPAYNPARE